MHTIKEKSLDRQKLDCSDVYKVEKIVRFSGKGEMGEKIAVPGTWFWSDQVGKETSRAKVKNVLGYVEDRL